MKLLDQLSLQTRLMLMIALLALTAMVSAGSAVINAIRLQEQLGQLESDLQRLEKRMKARSDFMNREIGLRNALLSPAEIIYHLGIQKKFTEEFNQYVRYELSNPDATDLEAIQFLKESLAGYETLELNLLQTVQDAEVGSGQPEPTFQIEETDIAAVEIAGLLRNQYIADLNQLHFQISEISLAIKNSAQQGGIILLLVGLLIIFSAATVNNIYAPLLSLSNALVEFETGTFKAELLAAHQQRGDELGRLIRSFGAMATSILESNRLKERFLTAAARFIPQQYLEFLEKEDITQVNLGDNVAAEMAVMFSDIRGFTSMSERMSAQENFDFINEYLNLISPIIQDNDGFIVKFLGDGMMAIFPYGVADAVQAGVQKQEAVKAFNARLAERGLGSINVGIGIHTGPMMVGMIGESSRMQGDAFSDNVNLTARIEGLNKFYGTSMIISEDTLRLLKNPTAYQMRFLGKAVVKGRVTPLGLYEVYHGLPVEMVNLRQATKHDFERGIALYSQGQFRAAHEAFSAVLAQDPQDKTARYYQEHSLEWLDRPRPGTWNGAIVMDAK